MKKIIKTLLIGIGAAIGIGKKATGSEVGYKWFDDKYFDAEFFNDYDGDVEDAEE